MRNTHILVFVTLIAFCLSTVVWAEVAKPAVPGPPPIATGSGFRTVIVGPRDSTSIARKAKGTMSFVANPGSEAKPESVEFQIDGKPIGNASSKPFKLEYDSTKTADGEHMLKVVGRDAKAKEVWSATTKIDVVNSKSTGAATPSVASREPQPVVRPVKTEKPDKKAPKPEANTKKGNGGKAQAVPAEFVLDQNYSNYGFSISYPNAWTFKDQTAMMKSKGDGDCWVAFAAYPVEKSKMVVNVRRVKLASGTNAAKFAQYNPYVKKWESTTMLGSPAFATTSHVVTGKQGVIHRAIIIKDGVAWMLNCEDFTGKPETQSLGLFQGMISSMGG